MALQGGKGAGLEAEWKRQSRGLEPGVLGSGCRQGGR